MHSILTRYTNDRIITRTLSQRAFNIHSMCYHDNLATWTEDRPAIKTTYRDWYECARDQIQGRDYDGRRHTRCGEGCHTIYVSY